MKRSPRWCSPAPTSRFGRRADRRRRHLDRQHRHRRHGGHAARATCPTILGALSEAIDLYGLPDPFGTPRVDGTRAHVDPHARAGRRRRGAQRLRQRGAERRPAVRASGTRTSPTLTARASSTRQVEPGGRLGLRTWGRDVQVDDRRYATGATLAPDAQLPQRLETCSRAPTSARCTPHSRTRAW